VFWGLVAATSEEAIMVDVESCGSLAGGLLVCFSLFVCFNRFYNSS
jgi:hypothetical protein